ncbi:uncharacterized protein RHOBADRAFT_38458 [Rhodotorula graminis WP1]|uniref:CASTOR ACT domain-containing protein n=1 Tax=Rhodotorula graminis (strain WP1) TaxID=578459 RepID=A0A0N8PZU1_RHOGW|nr:uncharacterized protein RHOBADRAFT_38458 [Rhodotorula graminis WP1]KPV73269.1 hypothetical protein RHOBADRAFT_38458 [Rhodotorula graminis WP1]
MSRLLECMWFRRENDPFFALCRNEVELSLFADAASVRGCFGDFMGPAASSRKKDHGPATVKGKERARDDGDDVLVGDELWVALEIAFGGNGWEEAAPRLHALTSPLAAASVSILFVSSFYADYVLVRASALGLVTHILESEGFAFAEADKAMEDELKGMRVREGEERAAGGGGGGRSSGTSTRRMSRSDGTVYDEEDEEEGLSDLVGSLVLSDAGSAGTAGGRGRRGSNEGAGASRSSSFSLSRSNSLHLSSTTTLPGATSPSLRSPAPSTTMAPPLSLLPDELVCVGLSPAHETQWRAKVVEALFFADRVLPRPPPGSSPTSPTSPSRPLSFASFSPASATLPLSRQASLNRHRQRSHSSARTSPPDDLPAPLESATPRARPSPPSRTVSTSLPTPLAPHPVPFVALTQTPDGTSLTADVRLLRRLFPPGCESAGDEMVFATGEAGLGGKWEGEDGLRGWEGEWEAMRLAQEEEDDDEDEEGEGEEGAELPVSSSEEEQGSSTADESEDEQDGDEWEAVSPSVDSATLPSADEDDDDDDDDGDPGLATTAHTASDRTLLKCLQLDLMSLGLDKPGLVEHYAQLLIDGGVRSLLYQSTYGSANILVAKRDVGRARRLLLRG